MKVISVVNRKGGVAKTATALTLGAGLKRKGYKVLFIDLDSQGNLTSNLDVTASQYTVFDIFQRKRKAVECITKANENYVIASSEALSNIDSILHNTIGAEYRLKEALESLRKNNSFDYAVIDTAPALDILTINSLTASDSVVIPVQAEVFSLDGLAKIAEVIASCIKYTNSNLKVNGVLITRYNSQTILAKAMKAEIEQLSEQLGFNVYKQPIRECIAVKEAQASNTDLFTYSPNCNASLDYQAFINELLESI